MQGKAHRSIIIHDQYARAIFFIGRLNQLPGLDLMRQYRPDARQLPFQHIQHCACTFQRAGSPHGFQFSAQLRHPDQAEIPGASLDGMGRIGQCMRIIIFEGVLQGVQLDRQILQQHLHHVRKGITDTGA